MEWITKNPGAIISLAVILIGWIGSNAILMDTVKTLKAKVEKLEVQLETHEKREGLHRTVDSEARISRIDAGISAIGSILTDVKENLARLGTGRSN